MENNNTIMNEVPSNGVGGPKKGDVDPVEASAFFIHQSHKDFRKLLYELSRKKKAAPRVLEAVLFEPLEKIELNGQLEKDLFELCQKIMYHKGVVMRYSFERASKKIKGEINEQEE